MNNDHQSNRQPNNFSKNVHAMKRWPGTAGVSLLLYMATSLVAFSEEPPSPAEITPPAGDVLFLATQAIGTQNYICLPSTTARANVWTFFSPQATLSVMLFGGLEQQVVTHFLSPVPGLSGPALPGCTFSRETNEVNCGAWQSSFDSSAVWGEKVGSLTSGIDPSCPNAGAIPCLLLKSVSNRHSQRSAGLLGTTTYIQRLKTIGGTAPTGSCKVGDQVLVPYQANYLFYKAENE